MIDYNNRTFKVAATSISSDTSEETIFLYKQEGNIVKSTYEGGNIKKGHLIGIVDINGTISMSYHHVNKDGEIMTGLCKSTPEVDADGLVTLREKWKWTSGDMSEGESLLKEVRVKYFTQQ